MGWPHLAEPTAELSEHMFDPSVALYKPLARLRHAT
jgi:hypothetical protein